MVRSTCNLSGRELCVILVTVGNVANDELKFHRRGHALFCEFRIQ